VKIGKVYIVGAGPGDPELITVKGLRVLREADVVVYDRLIPKELLKEAKKNAELIYAGKERGHHNLTQSEINELLAKKALEGKTVVRLKGGDPYVFGRGEEECMYLIKRGIPCEVIPGITSAIAVPAYAGIPVTHRYNASSLAIITGQEAYDKNVKRVSLEDIAKHVDTLVILMGIANLKYIVEKLLKVKNPKTPIAIIVNGTRPDQKVVIGTLENIVDIATRENIKPPAVIVVGEVVNLREKLWKKS